MKILLLTDIPPCKNYTAGLVINSWCDFLLEEGHEIYCALVKGSWLAPDIPKDKLEKIKFLEIQKPQEYWGLTEGTQFRIIRENISSFSHNNYIIRKELPRIASNISTFANRNGCELILASIQGQTITRLVRMVSKKTRLEYVAQTWDPLKWWLKANKFDPISSLLNLWEFERVVKGSRSFMAMSWAMANYFEKKYRVRCITNIPGLSKDPIKKSKIRRDKDFTISFAGQLYAKDEFKVLVNALKEMNWRHNGQKIKLNLYGPEFDTEYYNEYGISIYGYVEQEKLLRLLSNSDLLYCPYWFSREFEEVCKLSFPSKLTSYLKTKKPVLMHAPEYASPRILLEKNRSSYICNSLAVEDMINVIKSIIEDKNRDKIGRRGYQLFEKYMTFETMKKSLFVSLGLMNENEITQFEKVRELYS